MATSDGNEEVYLNLRHVAPWFKKKAMPKSTATKEMDEIPSQHNQAYNGFPGEDNNSSQSNERVKSVHDYMNVNDLVRNVGKPSQPDANTSGTPSVIYERFSDVLTPDKRNKQDEAELQTTNQHSSTNMNSYVRNVLLISVFVLIVSALSSIIAGLVVENVISKKFDDERTVESSRTERLKTNAEWSNWADWERCSVSCDLGLSSRQRKCLVQNTTVYGEYCIGLSHQEKICMEHPCTDGGWGQWGTWGSCSMSCGVGVRTRVRQCDNPKPSLPGRFCEGLPAESDICLLPSCTDGEWGDWGPWSSCSMTCGVGTRTRARRCDNATADCEGLPVTTDVCLSQACTDGVWSPWSPWGRCSATCNGGLRSRTRNCTDAAQSVFGKTCIGNDVNITICNTNKCKDPLVYFNAYNPNRVSGNVTFKSHIGNSSFNSTTGLFISPVTGVYYFTVNFVVQSSYRPYCLIYCIINSSAVIRSYTLAGGSSSYYWSAFSSAYCQLGIGDQAYLYCGYMTSIYSHSDIAFFTGALITPS